MPIYEYRCTACQHELEAIQKFSDAPLVTCPKCGHDTLTKLVSAAAFQLKGSGWYQTDFRGSGSKPASKDSGASGNGDQAAGEQGSGAKGSGDKDTGEKGKTGKGGDAGDGGAGKSGDAAAASSTTGSSDIGAAKPAAKSDKPSSSGSGSGSSASA